LLGFFSGIAVSLTGALIANILTRQRERRRLVEERRFEIYMKLMELNGQYFWISSAEVRQEPEPAEIRKNCHKLAWQIADLLRAADEVEFLEEILDVILNDSSFPSAAKRHDAMGSLLNKIGKRINPRYTHKIHEISQANVHYLASGGQSEAPGASRL
jgi:hypothetical protein